ncbi:GDSL-type esterase/lipase family protein [Aureibacillus halotolerans]|uniref:Lysophospholipase L1-like esterase n=1 Tax=Aureibacillus halotolerans TaxID=1508390 RepID=A0A4R6TUA7_9BACI|nr:GDSL-type esterase/lipase family protein [Aureibacillus halotolerans]TDQ33773.1 lysophospholipase L1-like esterase [Aureibacillus halotolerans]
MQKRWIGVFLAAAVTLLVTACGNQTKEEHTTASQLEEATEPPTDSLDSSYETTYQTSLFFGDSVTEGLSYHDILDEKNVLAGAGKTAEFALEDLPVLIERAPEHVYIQFGSIDLLFPTDDPIDYSLTHYGEVINTIQTELPEAEITLLSVTLVTEAAIEKEPRYQNIEAYNEEVKALAAKENVGYIDLTPLVTEHSDLYGEDGIHFEKAFYPLLLDSLKDIQNGE